METITLGLLPLVAVLVSAVVDQVVPKVSLPLIQIGMGLVIALFAPTAINIELDPEVFLVFFIAPLLYDEAKNADKRLLWRDKAPILSLAIGLVVATALAIGFSVHALVPSTALAAAFALGGALGPTDAVAVSSLSSRIDIPGRQKSILKGELLLNDASGIVTFQFAIAAAVTGTFSLASAVGNFLVEFFGGLGFGAVLGLLFNFIVRRVRSIGVENTTFHVLFEVCVPFVIYLIADACHVSGVIAVVVAGILNVIAPRTVGPSVSRMNIVSSNVWRVLTFALNGIVFVLLGTQLPNAMRSTWADASIGNGTLILLVLLLTLVLYAVRFIWTLGMEFVHARTGKERHRFSLADAKAALITTLSGAKGTITLSILFTIPVYLTGDTLFPQRDLIIFLACGVILCTLLVATFVVPLLAPKRDLKQSEIDVRQRDVACSMEVLRNVIEELNARRTPENRRETQAVIRAYNDRLSRLKEANDIEDEINVELRLQALQWEEEKTRELMEAGDVSDDVGDLYLERLEEDERNLERNGGRRTPRSFWVRLRIGIRRGLHRIMRRFSNSDAVVQGEELRKLHIEVGSYVIGKLDEMPASAEVPTEDIAALMLEYQRSVVMNRSGLTTARLGDDAGEDGSRLADRVGRVEQFAYEFELDQIQTMYEEGRLSRAGARRMRENVHLMQIDLDDTM